MNTKDWDIGSGERAQVVVKGKRKGEPKGRKWALPEASCEDPLTKLIR